MSNGYGVDIYGVATYGYSQPIDFSVAPFTATQSDYLEITLDWASPNTTAWKTLVLVRSIYGYPALPQDGQTILTLTTSNMLRTYTDAGLTPGLIYYYTMFVSVEDPSWNNSTTYQPGATVLRSGSYYKARITNTNVDPATPGTTWDLSTYAPIWYPAGYAATLAMQNDGYGSLLYNRTPQPYKISTSDTFSNASVDNPSLQNYLNVFGFGLDMLKNRYDSLLELNDPDVVSATSLDILGQQLGLNTDYLSTPQQRRQRIKNAATNYQLKGEQQSIHNIIADLAGWDSYATPSQNLLLSLDQSEFFHPDYDKWSPYTTYFVNQLIQFNGFNYKNILQSTGSAQAPTGAATSNTWWQYQTNVVDSTTLLNPGTKQQSTWAANFNNGATGSELGIATGLPSPPIAAAYANNNFNALAISISNATGDWSVNLAAPLSTPNYSAGTNYVTGNYVFNTVDSLYYVALQPNGPAAVHGVVTPGTNASFWKAIYFTTSDRPNHTTDTVPVPDLPFWNSTTKFTAGTQVQYQGIVYQAAVDNVNSPPTGYYYSNGSWIFINFYDVTNSVAAYFGKPGTDTNSWTATPDVLYYDAKGVAMNTPGQIVAGFNARFVSDLTDVVGTQEPGVAGLDPTSFVNVISSTWVGNAGIWSSKYGMAYVNESASGTTTYQTLLLSQRDPNTNAPVPIVGNVYLTFATDFADTTHYGHGLYVGNNSTNFYYATRKTLYQVNGGVETSLATWTRLKDGDRIEMEVSGTAVAVYKYARDGHGTKTLLANVTGAVTAGGYFGFIHKYSASGAV